MAFKLLTTAEKKWRRLRDYKLLADVVKGKKFKDGELVKSDQLEEIVSVFIHQI